MCCNEPMFLGMHKKSLKMSCVVGMELDSSKDAHRLLAKQLHASVDGRGLRHRGQTPHVNQWVTNGTALLSEFDFINKIKVRGNLLPLVERSYVDLLNFVALSLCRSFALSLF